MLKKMFALLSLICLLGCSSVSTQSMPSDQSAITTIPEITSTVASPHKITETPPIEIPGAFNASKQCLAVTADATTLLRKTYGTLVIGRETFTTALASKLEKPYLYDLETGKKTSIDGYELSVSLDGTMFAYLDNHEHNLLVADKNGKTLKAHPLEDDLIFASINRWVNDGLILEKENVRTFLNPFSGEKKILREDFPNRYIFEDYFSGIYREVYYNPELTQAIYFARKKDTQEFYFSLWDLLNRREITRIPQPGFGDYGSTAEWSLDNDLVIIRPWLGDDQFSLISVSKDGQIKTQLRQKVFSFSLSPNKKYIAFWTYAPVDENFSLSVLNLEIGDVVDYCIKSRNFPEIPLWSPDSHNIVIEVIDEAGDNASVILIDFEQKFATQIVEDVRPLGWMK